MGGISTLEDGMCTYKNPFAEYNSNTMTSQQIAELFAEPFELFNISTSDITGDKSSIVFVGGRGTGKTMLLRQFSYNVQKVLANKDAFLQKVKTDKYIGIYFRVDTPLLRSLEMCTSNCTDNNESASIFTHYFELAVFKEYLEVIKILLNDAGIDKENAAYKNAVTELAQLLYKQTSFKDIDELLKFVVDQINYIWAYQSQKAIDVNDTSHFEPSCGPILSGRLTNEFCKCSLLKTLGIENTCILLLIDEFENFSKEIQKAINTAMRFTKDYGARLRIGMRPSGFKTYDTLNADDFVKEGRDYRKVEFGNPLVYKMNSSVYPELLKKIAAKRLALVPEFKGKEITDFLGEKENLENEAKSIVDGKATHIEQYLKKINKVRKRLKLPSLDIDSLSKLRDDNPLYEMENLRLLLRGDKLEDVIKAFEDYKNGIKSPERKKYADDYVKKYKLSFVFVLVSIYKKEKKWYYGFTDFYQLSSGIIGGFLELCRRTFELAYFKDYEKLFQGKIADQIQTDAAYDYAYSERDMIQRIAKHGKKLSTFIDNVGNVFSYLHSDLHIKYPETNQFPISPQLSKENDDLIQLACMWSLIIKKQNVQDTKGTKNKQDLYILNRILAPVFKISYRTRGGINPVVVTDDYFETCFDPKSVVSGMDKFTDSEKNHQKNSANGSLLNYINDSTVDTNVGSDGVKSE